MLLNFCNLLDKHADDFVDQYDGDEIFDEFEADPIIDHEDSFEELVRQESEYDCLFAKNKNVPKNGFNTNKTSELDDKDVKSIIDNIFSDF